MLGDDSVAEPDVVASEEIIQINVDVYVNTLLQMCSDGLLSLG